MKTCTKCLLQFDLSAFYREAKARDGYRTTCKGCDASRVSGWRKSPEAKAKAAEADRKYRAKYPERNADKNRKWQAKQIKELGGSYLRRSLKRSGIEPYAEIVPMKREQLLLKRLATQMLAAVSQQKEHDEPVTEHP